MKENIVVTPDSTGSIMNRRNSSKQYFTEDLGDGVILEMVEIPGGTFLMGSPEDEEGRYSNESPRYSNESPQHQVTVSGFFMGKYPVTQEQYQAIMGINPSEFQGNGWTLPSNFLTSQRPVEQVSWDDAIKFCQRLSQKTGQNYTLPSEAQWEYACRARTTTPFYFGESITTELVNCNYHYKQTTDVGTFPPNAFGLYDMHGNVSEWCLDNWANNYNNAPTDGSAVIDQSEGLVIRGGSWFDGTWHCRSGSRHSFSSDFCLDTIGFRVCLNPGS